MIMIMHLFDREWKSLLHVDRRPPYLSFFDLLSAAFPVRAIKLLELNPACRNNHTVFPAGFPLGWLGRFMVISKGL